MSKSPREQNEPREPRLIQPPYPHPSGVRPPLLPAEEPLVFPCTACGRRLRVKAQAAGTRVRCPYCKAAIAVPDPEPALEADVVLDDERAPQRTLLTLGNATAVLLMILVIVSCSVYANLSFAVTDRTAYKYFPPFKPFVNANDNRHLGAEYYCIAKAMVAGEAVSDVDALLFTAGEGRRGQGPQAFR